MESQFILTVIDEKTVTYDLGEGAMPCESSFYAAGYGDFIAVEHHTLKYFGTKHIPVSAVTVNGATFATDTEAVAAINALDVFGEKPETDPVAMPIVSAILSKIPPAASATNQLADKTFVVNAVAGAAELFNTDAAWEAADLATLQSWIDTATDTAHDPANDRDIANFDVYLALDTMNNYYWDEGAWVPLAQSPEAGIDIVRAWSEDNATVHVRLSAAPAGAVTAGSFDVYSAKTGETIEVQSVSGANIDYTITIQAQTADYGITFTGQ